MSCRLECVAETTPGMTGRGDHRDEKARTPREHDSVPVMEIAAKENPRHGNLSRKPLEGKN